MFSKTEVTFSLFIGDNLDLNEQELNARLDMYRPRLRNLDKYLYFEGVIHISYPGQPVVKADDEMPAIVQNLCFIAIPKLIDSKDIVIEHIDHYGNIKLTHELSNIIISGNDIPTIKVPRSELIPELYKCGQRFIQFLINLKGETEDSKLEDLIHYLEDKGEIARKALENMEIMENEKQN